MLPPRRFVLTEVTKHTYLLRLRPFFSCSVPPPSALPSSLQPSHSIPSRPLPQTKVSEVRYTSSRTSFRADIALLPSAAALDDCAPRTTTLKSAQHPRLPMLAEAPSNDAAPTSNDDVISIVPDNFSAREAALCFTSTAAPSADISAASSADLGALLQLDHVTQEAASDTQTITMVFTPTPPATAGATAAGFNTCCSGAPVGAPGKAIKSHPLLGVDDEEAGMAVSGMGSAAAAGRRRRARSVVLCAVGGLISFSAAGVVGHFVGRRGVEFDHGLKGTEA